MTTMIDVFKTMVTEIDFFENMTEEIEVGFERCFLESFYLEPTANGITCEMVANFKDGSQYLYTVPVKTLLTVFTEEHFGKAFNTYIRPLNGERLG